MRLFVERLAEEYFDATGEVLFVTSLTRPTSAQPRNASALSVHPTGLALDLRISSTAHSRQWIERRLLAMEKQGLLDVTREMRPPHYHIALFPAAYLSYVEGLMGSEALAIALHGGADMETVEEAQTEVLLVPVEAKVAPPPRRSPWALLSAILARWRSS